MGDRSGSGTRPLNPVTATGGKHGPAFPESHSSVSKNHQHSPNNNNNHTTSAATSSHHCQQPEPPRQRKGGSSTEGGTTTQPDPADPGDRLTATATTSVSLPQMSVEARHAISETLKEMGTGEEAEGGGLFEDAGDEDVFVQDDDDDDNANSIGSLPSIADPLPSLPLQRRSWHPSEAISSHHQQQQSRENSLTASYKTSTTATRQKSYRSGRQTDGGSTLTGAGRGGRTPRRSNAKKTSSLHVQAGTRGRTGDSTGVGSGDRHLADHARMDLRLLTNGHAASDNRSSPLDAREESVQRTHLPAITSRTEPGLQAAGPARRDLNGMRHIHYRIRGVGSYRVARENTFEITGPGFDVRYRDVISCQKGERETPPPEIFEESVGKVRDWLDKYYSPYSPS